MTRIGLMLTAMMMASLLATSCIDEDLKNCGKDYRINYHVNLKTNMEVEIANQLSAESEQAITSLLRSSLCSVFSDYAKDNDLSFYVGGNLFRHEANEMNSNSASYTIYLQKGEYQNLVLANTKEETEVTVIGQDAQSTLALRQKDADEVESHRVGLFSARLPIKDEDFDHDLNAYLYMQNCAVAVVIDRGNFAIEDLTGFVTGMATSFAVNDSTYAFERDTKVRARRVSDSHYDALYTVSFPSRSTATSTEDGIYQMHVVVKMNGKYTGNTLHINEPLKAGNLKIIKVKLQEDGSVMPVAGTSIGVSVKLDWKPGGNHEVDI